MEKGIEDRAGAAPDIPLLPGDVSDIAAAARRVSARANFVELSKHPPETRAALEEFLATERV